MLVVRPAGPADLDFLLELAILSGPSFKQPKEHEADHNDWEKLYPTLIPFLFGHRGDGVVLIPPGGTTV
jgi:hypothetical protein